MSAAAAPSDGPSPSRPNVLLVEDHPDSRQMYAEFLSDAFEVLTAADATRALDIVRGARIDLLITDLSLPGLDGFQLCEAIRLDLSISPMPIICLSGYSGHDHDARAREVGCDRILQKPCMPDVLLRIVRDLLTAQDASRP